jgi:hypothetical protein
VCGTARSPDVPPRNGTSEPPRTFRRRTGSPRSLSACSAAEHKRDVPPRNTPPCSAWRNIPRRNRFRQPLAYTFRGGIRRDHTSRRSRAPTTVMWVCRHPRRPHRHPGPLRPAKAVATSPARRGRGGVLLEVLAQRLPDRIESFLADRGRPHRPLHPRNELIYVRLLLAREPVSSGVDQQVPSGEGAVRRGAGSAPGRPGSLGHCPGSSG